MQRVTCIRRVTAHTYLLCRPLGICAVSEPQMNLKRGPHPQGDRVVDPCGPQSVRHLQHFGSSESCLQELHCFEHQEKPKRRRCSDFDTSGALRTPTLGPLQPATRSLHPAAPPLQPAALQPASRSLATQTCSLQPAPLQPALATCNPPHPPPAACICSPLPQQWGLWRWQEAIQFRHVTLHDKGDTTT